MDSRRGPNGPLLRRKHIFWAVLACLALAVLLGVWQRDVLVRGTAFLFRLQEHKEQFRDWLNSFGPLGPLVFIGIQVLQVVFSPIPGELTGFLGGYVYGAWMATLYSTVGLTLGSWLAFVLGRWLGRPFVEKLIPRKVLDKFDFLVTSRGAVLAFIFFSIPGFPKDYMCYLLGLSPLRTNTFVLVALFGRIPGTVMLGLQGANLYQEKYGLFFVLLVVMIALAAAGMYFAEPIRIWLRGKL